jgi:hypothetical protein
MSTELPSGIANEDLNPYAPPKAAIDEAPIELDAADLAEAIRRTYIGHEAAVKSIGTLHYLGFFFGLLGAIGMMIGALLGPLRGNQGAQIVMMGVGVFYLALSALQLAPGIGLRRLQIWARWTDVALISLLLLMLVLGNLLSASQGVPGALIGLVIGGLIPGYILYLLISSKSTTVFSTEYRAIIARTPHIKRRTSLLVQAVLAFLVVGLVAGIVAAIAGR